ncbi:aldehyde dehydrogenase (NADP(+)) [Gimesia fumaroli]|uniref:NADP-dependent fatty aldehyde dehydrogenase n=1 Tax=Gimesia fumaroli TaxID=2527976 RepID=A0A518IE08_9PLAN|nr:aldehyde dehydrogenase (NADP(+)) [Gimesia fumaroli]QDV51334.1 NADP-dependent fatty aldehyde dehydrogenase [Gimesia fumaroli]
MQTQPVLINGQWIESTGTQTFQAVNPATTEALEPQFPVSPWDEIESAVQASAAASKEMRGWPGERFAAFLESYAEEIEKRADALVEAANLETGYPESPRLRDGELPRTTNQLRQAATHAREGSWALPTIDTATGIGSLFGPIGPVTVFGPNNFPFAFNSIAGGDFAAAVAAGNPVIAKGHSSHPKTTQIFAEAADAAAKATNMPTGFVQLIYRTSHADGCRLVSHPLMGAIGYTGGRSAGLTIKEAADKAGKPVYLELSSINPVFVLPEALTERSAEIAEEFKGSCLMGTGQFCTNPGLVALKAGAAADAFIEQVKEKFEAAPAGILLGEGVQKGFLSGIAAIQSAGATLVTGGSASGNPGFSCANTLLKVSASQFLESPEALQEEAFGNASLFVLADSDEELAQVAECLEGNLTGCIYSHTDGKDDALYDQIAPALRQKVGRLLNDKMPTGVAVSPAMNHGGPFPSTGHPVFTSVGIPAAIHRFSMLQCYDNVRLHRLPDSLKPKSPNPDIWRYIDGMYTQGDYDS